ncbi:DUF697 domain-containing protein [bacterium]|nr:DUF697 domain-containing protein [bacterium]
MDESDTRGGADADDLDAMGAQATEVRATLLAYAEASERADAGADDRGAAGAPADAATTGVSTADRPRRHETGRAAAGDPRLVTRLAAVAAVVLVLLTVLGSVLTIGDHLMAASAVLGWAFYALVAVVVVAGVVYPVVQVARRPVFSLYQLRDESGHARRRHCRMLVDNLVQNTELTDDEVTYLESCLQAGDEADDLLIAFFNDRCLPQIDAQIRRHATTAFLATAISHSALVDTVTMLSVCLDLVRSVVTTCGFRPTRLGLARLYARVMLSALVAGGLDDADLDGLIGTALGGGTGARGAGIVLGSATAGLVDAFLVFRVGVITKRWLCAEDGPARMASIRRRSYGEALTMMRTSGFMSEVATYVRRGAAAAAGAAASAVKTAATNATEAASEAARQVVRSGARHTAEAAASAAGIATGMVAGAAEAFGRAMRRRRHDGIEDGREDEGEGGH